MISKKKSTQSEAPPQYVEPRTTTEVPQQKTQSPTHCPYRQSALLLEAMAPNKMRIAFFLGAGCPVSIRVGEGDASLPLIPDVLGLTKKVKEQLNANAAHKPVLEAVLLRLKSKGKEDPTVEEILTFIRTLKEVVGDTNHNGLTSTALDGLETEICAITTSVVKVELPNTSTPYNQLSTWIGGIQREHAIEIFTPNYDLLIEQSLEEASVPYFDGFVGSYRTFFDQSSIEHDNLPARWARLWKIHGSINWWKTKENNVQRYNDSKGDDRQMIYPSHLKYEESRRMPYLTMLDRLRSFLGRGQSVLVTCGYSFADDHVNDVILQGLKANANSICFAMVYGDKSKYPAAVKEAKRNANLNLLAADGAIIGTVERDWHIKADTENPFHGLSVRDGKLATNLTQAPEERCKFLLGDFKILGEFLAQQLSNRDEVKKEV